MLCDTLFINNYHAKIIIYVCFWQFYQPNASVLHKHFSHKIVIFLT